MDEDDIACLQNSVQKPWEPAGAEEVGHHGPLHVNHPPPPHHGLHTQVFRQLKLLPCCDWVLKTANQKSEKVYIEDSLKSMFSRHSTPSHPPLLQLWHKIWVDFLS